MHNTQAKVSSSPARAGLVAVHTSAYRRVQERRLEDLWRVQNQGDCVSFVATKGKNPPSGW
jgi:hypothetical protein